MELTVDPVQRWIAAHIKKGIDGLKK
jgi:hypothetical protein